MRHYLPTLLAAAMLSACATAPDVSQPGAGSAAKKRTASTPPKPKVAPEARPVVRLSVGPGAPLDSVVIQHRNRGKPAVIAAVGGALERSAVEDYMAQQTEELLRALQSEVETGDARIERRSSDQAVRVSFTPGNGFDNLSSVVKPELHASLSKIVPLINQYNKTLLTVIGYIETNGADAGNQKLAERRAKSVSDLFISQSVEPLRVQSFARNDPATPDTPPTRRIELWIQPLLTP